MNNIYLVVLRQISAGFGQKARFWPEPESGTAIMNIKYYDVF